MPDVIASVVDSFDAGEALMRRMRKPIVMTHARPDGDAIGAVQAVRLRMLELNADPRPVLFDAVPARYGFLLRHGALPVLGRDADPVANEDADGIIIVDTCARNQIEPLFDFVSRAVVPKLVIDHHVTRDLQADVMVIDPTASATCLMLQEWATRAEWSVSPAMAESLFTGVATDTGWFRHANTDGRTLAAAGELAWLGVRPHELFERLHHQDSAGRFRLRAAALRSVELLGGDRLALMIVPLSMFAECGATMPDTEDLVNEPFLMRNVRVSVMLVEHEGGVVRVGLRSREPVSDDDPDVDVSDVARRWGGGGHRRAAGVRMNGTLRDVRNRVVDELAPRIAPV